MTHGAPSSAHHLLRCAYEAFNARDLTSALSAMHPNVEWPNAADGGIMHGRDQIADYWKRQWDAGDPHVEPVRIDAEDDRHLIVAVHQIIRSLTGQVISERFVEHAFLFEDGLIRRMEIRGMEPDRDTISSLDA